MEKKQKSGTTPNHEIQAILNLRPVTEKEIDGIGMGVLSDGTAYLTARGLARMCGIDHTKVLDVANNWTAEQFKPRGVKIANSLHEQGFDASSLFREIEINGSIHHAFPDEVCMAFLEYYAFGAGKNVKDHARKNHRILSRSSLRVFVYTQVGYDPKALIPNAWRAFQDRVSISFSKVPVGYFSIFKEIADMTVSMIQGGIDVGQKTVPDISVGIHWSNHWCGKELHLIFGDRIKFEQDYPDYFPQAASNPHEPWAYPETALAEFRQWMRDTYYPVKYPAYLGTQVKKNLISASLAESAINAVNPKRIEQP